MITKTMAFKVGEQTFATFQDAQLESIMLLISDPLAKNPNVSSRELAAKAVAGIILDHADKIVEILTCQPDEEKPVRKPRKDKGTKRAKVIPIEGAPVPYEKPTAQQTTTTTPPQTEAEAQTIIGEIAKA